MGFRLISGMVGALWLSMLPAGADVIHLRTGQLEGKVIERAEGRVTIRTTSGIVTTVNEDAIVRIDSRETPREVYKRMAAKLKPDDSAGRFALAHWCRDHGLRDEAVEQFVAVLRIDPDHARARRELGYIKTEHGWLTRDQAMRAEGKVQVDGRWMTPDEADKLARTERSRKQLQWINAVVLRLRSASDPVRADLAARLAAFDDPALAWKMINLLSDRLADIRRAACLSLAKMKHAPAVAELMRLALVDPDEDVQTAALRAAARIDRDQAVASLNDLVAGLRLQKIKDLREQRTVIRLYRQIALILHQIGDIRCVPMAIAILYPKVEIAGTPPEASTGLSITRSGSNPAGLGTTTTGTELGRAESVPPPSERYYFNQAAENLLKKLTGQNLGVLPQHWRAWWNEHGPALLRKREAEERAGQGQADQLLKGAAGDAE
jgi:hypothetical protein